MKNFRFHDLRHTFITQGIEDNVPVEVMMAQVGHVSAEMTRYYTHLSSGTKDNAVQKIAARNQGVRSVLEMGEGARQPANNPRAVLKSQAFHSRSALHLKRMIMVTTRLHAVRQLAEKEMIHSSASYRDSSVVWSRDLRVPSAVIEAFMHLHGAEFKVLLVLGRNQARGGGKGP